MIGDDSEANFLGNFFDVVAWLVVLLFYNDWCPCQSQASERGTNVELVCRCGWQEIVLPLPDKGYIWVAMRMRNKWVKQFKGIFYSEKVCTEVGMRGPEDTKAKRPLRETWKQNGALLRATLGDVIEMSRNGCGWHEGVWVWIPMLPFSTFGILPMFRPTWEQ